MHSFSTMVDISFVIFRNRINREVLYLESCLISFYIGKRNTFPNLPFRVVASHKVLARSDSLRQRNRNLDRLLELSSIRTELISCYHLIWENICCEILGKVFCRQLDFLVKSAVGDFKLDITDHEGSATSVDFRFVNHRSFVRATIKPQQGGKGHE